KFALPAVAVGEKSRLVIIKFLPRLGREFEIRTLDDRIDRTGLLAQPAIDAFHHVDVVTNRAPRPIIAPGTRLDRDRLRRANRLAQLAGNAALLTIRITAQRVLAAKTR